MMFLSPPSTLIVFKPRICELLMQRSSRQTTTALPAQRNRKRNILVKQPKHVLKISSFNILCLPGGLDKTKSSCFQFVKQFCIFNYLFGIMIIFRESWNTVTSFEGTLAYCTKKKSLKLRYVLSTHKHSFSLKALYNFSTMFFPT